MYKYKEPLRLFYPRTKLLYRINISIKQNYRPSGSLIIAVSTDDQICIRINGSLIYTSHILFIRKIIAYTMVR